MSHQTCSCHTSCAPIITLKVQAAQRGFRLEVSHRIPHSCQDRPQARSHQQEGQWVKAKVFLHPLLRIDPEELAVHSPGTLHVEPCLVAGFGVKE
jgi:hypothetical protein